MDQPRPTAALGHEPIRTISRDELKVKIDRGGPFKLIMALNRWAFEAKHIPGSLHFDTPDELYATVRPFEGATGVGLAPVSPTITPLQARNDRHNGGLVLSSRRESPATGG